MYSFWSPFVRRALSAFLLVGIAIGGFWYFSGAVPAGEAAPEPTELRVQRDTSAHTIAVYRAGGDSAIVTQHARPTFRPYLHPIVAPDGRGVLTQYQPGHHTHQTGLYWGFTDLNGRDYFHHPGETHWRRVQAEVLAPSGTSVRWRTVYHLLDAHGDPVLEETQIWSMREEDGAYYLDLEWRGKALEPVTVGEYDYGGLFLRMPWSEGTDARVVNAARDRGMEAEGERAMWLDLGMEVPGRSDMAHVAIFDHPDNAGFPQPWRVDGQYGVGPSRARLGDWSIAEGETEVINHRLLVYTERKNNAELRTLWEAYSGQEGQYSTASLWELAQEEGRQAEFLTPEEAADAFTVPEGFRVNAWAGDSLIRQPMAFAWDDEGRMWVAENMDYESRQTGFSGSGGKSRIVILEDTDRDGEADTRKVFLEGIPFPSALEVGFGGVFIAAPPNLLFAPDENGDDRLDEGGLEILLTGWGIRDRHEVVNSFHWGPDGWLYGLEGFATSSRIHPPTEDTRLYEPGEPFPEDVTEGKGTPLNGGVWRYHPVKDTFEVVAHGFSNPWGIDYNAKGELFITACVIPHVFHVVGGGRYHRQGGQHFNPYVYSDIKTIVDHRHRSAHGGARIYQSDAFPEKHRGRLFMANIHEHAVLSDILSRKGSGFVASHGQDFAKANNAQWVGFSMEVGPGGNMYALDWHDGDICGSAVLDQNTGRIFRITHERSTAPDWPGRYGDLSEMSDVRLAEMQTRTSNWHARRARVILQHRATEGPISREAAAALRDIYENHDQVDYRLRGMWALHVTGELTEEGLIAATRDENEYVRSWAVRMLVEDEDPSTRTAGRFVEMAEDDPSPVVRKYLASGLQRMDHAKRWPIARALVQRSADAGDHNIPKLIWYGIEPLVPADPERALELGSVSEQPMVSRFIARRAVDADTLAAVVDAMNRSSDNRLPFLEGVRAGLEGRGELQKPDGWDALYAELRRREATARTAAEIAQQFGDGGAAELLLETVRDEGAAADRRRRALGSLADQQHPGLAETIPELLGQSALRRDAIEAVAAYDRQALGELLLERYGSFTPTEKNAALRSLAARPTYGWLLTQAIESGEIAKSEVPPDVARQLRRVVGSGFVEVWGPIDGSEVDVAAAYEEYRSLLTDEAIADADPRAGRLVYEETCGTCHRMYGEGGLVGPDLTGSNRQNVDYILSNVLQPSATIQEDYRMVVVTTTGGRTLIGSIANETDSRLTLRVIGRGEVTIPKSEIQSREVSANSLMPTGLFASLSESEILDLMAYLRTDEQVPTPGD